jgi:hypothetical protein
MTKTFVSGGIYRHSSPYATCDLKVLKVVHQNEEGIKIKYQLVSRSNGEVFYLDFGPLNDTTRIKIENLEDWTRLK